MTTDELVLQALHNSTLSEELRDSEVELLASCISVRDYKAGEAILKPGDNELKDTLLILGSGDVEATATTGGEQMTLHLLQPGDLAGIIGFVGGNVMQISATVTSVSMSVKPAERRQPGRMRCLLMSIGRIGPQRECPQATSPADTTRKNRAAG